MNAFFKSKKQVFATIIFAILLLLCIAVTITQIDNLILKYVQLFFHKTLRNPARWLDVLQNSARLFGCTFALIYFLCFIEKGKALCANVKETVFGYKEILFSKRSAFFFGGTILFLLFVYSNVILANYFYADDVFRNYGGNRSWIGFSRYILEFTSIFIHNSLKLTDIAPLTQIIAIVVSSTTLLVLSASLTETLSVKNLLALSVIFIAPFYADKYQKKTVMAGELRSREHAMNRFSDILEWKNLTLTGVYGASPYTIGELMEWVSEYGQAIRPFICDTGKYLHEEVREGKNILFEAQLGSLRDLDFGIYPYTTSSNAIAAYAPVGSGLPGAKLDEIIGVVKAYSTCVGEGPFTCEMFGREAEELREAGLEYGAKTGRPRRVGPIDIVATRYGVRMQAATGIALTKLDVLSYMDRIPICARYELYGKQTDEFPFPAALEDAKPVLEYMEGWKCDISGVRTWNELPEAAKRYVEYIEKQIECPITYVSVGPEREAYIRR